MSTIVHPAEIYNKARAIVFSTYNKYGKKAAYSALDKQKASLDTAGWFGLKGELDFFVSKSEDLELEIAADFGQKFDFSGVVDGKRCRIDVTTNLNFKNLETYAPFQKKEKRLYKLALMNKETGKLEDIVDINFPFDDDGRGRIFEILLLMPSDRDEDGGWKYNFYQEIYTVSSSAPEERFEHLETITDNIEDIDYLYYLEDYYAPYMNMQSKIPEHCAKSAKYVSKRRGKNIVAVGQRELVRDKNDLDDEGEYITKLYWKHPIIENHLNDIIHADIVSC